MWLSNIEYLIANMENNIARVKKEICLFRISKYFFILEIVIGIGISIFGSGDYQKIGLLFMGFGIVSLLIILLGFVVDRKKLEMYIMELSKMNYEKANYFATIREDKQYFDK